MAAPVPRNFMGNVIRVTHDSIVLGMAQSLANAIKQTDRQIDDVITTLGQALDQKKIPSEKMFKANVAIAEKAHAAVVAGWYSRLPRKTWLGSTKHLHGYLGRALADPNNTAYTTDRVISFVNTELLDREAPHWYRVNYGAAGSRFGEGRKAKRFVMELNGSTFASFTDDLRPDPISWIPVRRFVDSDGNLFPLSRAVERSPYGARAARFFDLGHAVVAKETPRAYEAVWREYILTQGDQGKRRLKKAGINVNVDFRVQRNSWTYRIRTAA